MEPDQAKHADQHERRTEHGVDEELHGRVVAVSVTPVSDQEIHRHEHDLEEHKEHEQVECNEHTKTTGLQNQQPRVVRLGTVLGNDGVDRQWEQQHGQHDEPQRDAVDPRQPADAERLDP